MADYEWSCTSCTYINRPGSFKCSVCGTPKGTATRQVKFHMSALEQQYVAESFQSINRLQQSSHASNKLQNQSNSSTTSTTKSSPPKLSPSSSTSSSSSSSINGEAVSDQSSTSSTTSSNSSSGGGGGQSGSNQLGKRKLRSRPLYNKPHLSNKWPLLPNLDRTSKRDCRVTVNGVTVTITEYDTIRNVNTTV